MGLVWWVWWCCCKFESIHFSCPGASFTSASTFAVTLDAASTSSCLESLMVTDNRFKIGGIDLFIKLQNMAIKRNELKHKCRVVVFRYNHKIAVVVVHHWRMPRNVDVKLLTTEPSNCGRHRLSGPASKPAKRLGFCQDSPKNHDFYHKLSQVMSTHFPYVSTWPC